MDILTAPIIQYALTEQFGVFFHFSDIIAFIKANLGGYIIALVVSMILLKNDSPVGILNLLGAFSSAN
jgi:hypothetical protein